MSSVIDDGVVGLLVLGAIAYVATALGPRDWRGRALAALARALAAFGLRGVAQRLNDKAAAKAGSACGGCDSCATPGSPSGTPSTVAPGAAPGAGSREVRIPLSKIGKRG